MSSRRPDEPTGTESVWDYPRPPAVESVAEKIRVVHHGIIVADTSAGQRVLETSHPPVYYVPPADVRRDLLHPSPRQSVCEFKGVARYWHLMIENVLVEDVAWSYPDPPQGYQAVRDHLAFYAGKVDGCWVGEERVAPQPGDFYGGWITSRVTGPFKGGPGTLGW